MNVVYTWGPGIDQPLAETRGTTKSFYEADGLGTITSLTTSAGAIGNTYTYGSYGKSNASSGTIVNTLRYTGRELDPETNLYYYRARYYDQNIGRFISEDPIDVDGGSIDFYTYVGNDPISFDDPLGLRLLNPNNYPISRAVREALQKFNQMIGCDKDIVVTGGDRSKSSPLGAKTKSTHVQHLAADIAVVGQIHLETANQADLSGLFGGIGWYEEGYHGRNGEGQHVHVDLRKGTARWGFSADGTAFHGYFPAFTTKLNPSKCACEE